MRMLLFSRLILPLLHLLWWWRLFFLPRSRGDIMILSKGSFIGTLLRHINHIPQYVLYRLESFRTVEEFWEMLMKFVEQDTRIGKHRPLSVPLFPLSQLKPSFSRRSEDGAR